MGTQLAPPQPGTLPLYVKSNTEGYHLSVLMPGGQVLRQPFGLDSVFDSYEAFEESSVLPHLIALLDIVYDVEPAGEEKSVWAKLEYEGGTESYRPNFNLDLNPNDGSVVRSWKIRLDWKKDIVAKLPNSD